MAEKDLEIHLGTVLEGRFKVISRTESGGMAEVYRGLDPAPT